MSPSDNGLTIGDIVGIEEYASELADHYASFDIPEAEAVLIANGFKKPASRAQGELAMLIAKGQVPAEPTNVQTKHARRPRQTPTLARGYKLMLEGGS